MPKVITIQSRKEALRRNANAQSFLAHLQSNVHQSSLIVTAGDFLYNRIYLHCRRHCRLRFSELPVLSMCAGRIRKRSNALEH